jgi:hypothetical protein
MIGWPLESVECMLSPYTRVEFINERDIDMDIYYPGSAVNVRFKCYDNEGRLIDPDTVAVSIYDPTKKKIVDAAGCTKLSEGYYKYTDLVLGSIHIAGIWIALPEITDSDIKTVTPAYEFEYRKVE